VKKIIIFLCLLSFVGFSIQPALSSLVKVEIHVVDGGTPVPKATVEIWSGDTMVSGQAANSKGIYESYLDNTKKYDICATIGQQLPKCISNIIPTSKPIYIDIGGGF
jgi:hypothetical protein